MPDFPSIGEPFDGVNGAFHARYDHEREDAGKKVPVLVVLQDELVLVWDGDPIRRTFTTTPFHVAKSIAHAPVAAYILLSESPVEGPERERALGSLAAWLADIEPKSPLVELTMTTVTRALARQPIDLDQFARDAGAMVLGLTERATQLQLEDLHRATSELLSTLTSEEREAVVVVVTGDHQARVRSLGMQYFQKRLGEPSGAERRVLYAEGVSELDDALALVGKNRLDRKLARAFFGDERRLQRDVLGDAAARLLSEWTF